MAFTRRRFLAGSAAAYLAPLARTAAAGQADLDVAIIGGGVSGAYTAWRLRNQRPDLRVNLFEMSDRIGGRLRSVHFPQAPHLIGEAGGMRFLESQKHVFNLVRHLRLPKRGYPVFATNDRLYFRGRNYTYAEAGVPPHLFPYNMPPSEQSPKSHAFMDAISRIVPDAKKMTPERWRSIRSNVRYKGRLLKDWAAWALLADVLTHEAMMAAQDAAGYDDIALHQNGLDELDFVFLGIDFSKPFYTLVDGYQRLPVKLAQEAQRLGANTDLQTRLVKLVAPASPKGVFTLAFRDKPGRIANMTAARVVLAMPRHAIELIPESPARRDPQFAELLASVNPVPACKAFLLYPKPWWRDLGITGGRSVTDLPARQFYPLGTEKERLPTEPANGYCVLMMYCDSSSVEYWRETVQPAPADAAGFQWLSGDSQLAQEVHREAGLVYQTKPPKPLAACFQDWSADPYGGGWHFWGLGKDNAVLADRVLKPLDDRELHICGEAYGIYDAGWVETALERAETMLQRHFGLRAPAWLA